jgi:hypothetical protein
MTDEENPVDQAVDNLFEGADETEIATEVETEAVKDEESEPKGETETNEEEAPAESEEKTETEPPSEEKEQKLVPIAALHDVRRKAQQLKEENDNLRGQLPKNDEAPDPYEDLEAYNAYNRAQWQREQQMEQTAKNTQRIETMRSKMLEQHDDFVEMENIFSIMLASDQSLMGKMLESGNEVEFAYNAAKGYKASLLGGVAEKTETVEPSESELRNKSATELPNLAKATAQASNTNQLEKESDIDDIFEDQKY